MSTTAVKISVEHDDRKAGDKTNPNNKVNSTPNPNSSKTGFDLSDLAKSIPSKRPSSTRILQSINQVLVVMNLGLGSPEEELASEVFEQLVKQGFDAVTDRLIRTVIEESLTSGELVRLLNEQGLIANYKMISRLIDCFTVDPLYYGNDSATKYLPVKLDELVYAFIANCGGGSSNGDVNNQHQYGHTYKSFATTTTGSGSVYNFELVALSLCRLVELGCLVNDGMLMLRPVNQLVYSIDVKPHRAKSSRASKRQHDGDGYRDNKSSSKVSNKKVRFSDDTSSKSRRHDSLLSNSSTDDSITTSPSYCLETDDE